jgi:hypothetical protein
MTDQFSLWPEMTSPDTTNATSSPESASGREPSPTPSGGRTGASGDQFGPGHLHVSRFRSLDSERAMSTNATSGPLFTHSSISAALQRSLESKLRQRMGENGWPLFAMTWRPADMPSGPPSCRLQASARRISATGFSSLQSSWPTPALTDHKGGYLGGRIRNGELSTDRLDVTAQLAGWPTPQCADDKNSRIKNPQAFSEARLTRENKCSNLADTAQALAAWPTPNASEPSGDLRLKQDRETRDPTQPGSYYQQLGRTVSLAAWPTPMVPTGGRSTTIEKMDATGRTADGRKHTASLEHVTKFAAWPTPGSDEGGGGKSTHPESGGMSFSTAAQLAAWPTPVKEDARSSARDGYMIEGHSGTTLLDAARLAGPPARCRAVHATDRPSDTGNRCTKISARSTHAPRAKRRIGAA